MRFIKCNIRNEIALFIEVQMNIPHLTCELYATIGYKT